MQKIIITIVTIWFFSGCAIIKSSEDSFKFKYFKSTGTTNFNILTKNLLADLCPTINEIKSKKARIEPLYVTDFVNLNNLHNTSKLGFILADEVKTNVTQDCNWPIKQIEFAKYLSIGKNGTNLLSRDVNEIKTTSMNDNTYALVGTYMVTQRQLIIYLKLINLKNGVILKSSTKRLTLTDEIINLENGDRSLNTNNIYQPVVI
jgi:TolB-like protein